MKRKQKIVKTNGNGKKSHNVCKKKKKIWTLVNNHDNKQCMRDSKLMTCVL